MLEVNFNPFPEIKTERLLLRRLVKDDVSQMFTLRSNEKVMKFIGKPTVKTIEEALDFYNLIDTSLENNTGISWAITLKEMPEKMIGTIGLWRLIKENYRAEIGYMLLPEYWRKGITNEAVLAVNSYGFNEMNLHSIEAHISPKNIGSATILEKTGFVREAYFKEDFFFNGVFEDTAIYSLLNKKN